MSSKLTAKNSSDNFKQGVLYTLATGTEEVVVLCTSWRQGDYFSGVVVYTGLYSSSVIGEHRANWNRNSFVMLTPDKQVTISNV